MGATSRSSITRLKNKSNPRSEIGNGDNDDNGKGKMEQKTPIKEVYLACAIWLVVGLLVLDLVRGRGGGGGKKVEVGLLRSSPIVSSSSSLLNESLNGINLSDAVVANTTTTAAVANTTATTTADAAAVARAVAEAEVVFPPECYWQCYYDRYDFSKSGMERTQAKAERNYIMHGKEKGRDCKCKFPKECDWECYYDRYPGFAKSGMERTKEKSVRNYIIHGVRSGRICTCD